jgi:hypothetical protein
MAHETVIGKERRKMTQCMIEEEEEVADDDPGIVSSSIFPGKRRSSRKRAINNASNRNCHRGSEDSSIDLFLNIVSLKLFILLFVFSFSSLRQTELAWISPPPPPFRSGGKASPIAVSYNLHSTPSFLCQEDIPPSPARLGCHCGCEGRNLGGQVRNQAGSRAREWLADN